jgi:hypothetical protein
MRSRIISGVFAMLALPWGSFAALGGDATSVQADQLKMQGSLRTTSGNAYNVHEIQVPTGVTVREFVSPAGKVFAVAWQGPVHPDLQQLLGTYYEQYTQAVQAQRATRRARGPLVIQEPGLVVQVSGHMRSFVGRAYVPQMMPAGVKVEDIR